MAIFKHGSWLAGSCDASQSGAKLNNKNGHWSSNNWQWLEAVDDMGAAWVVQHHDLSRLLQPVTWQEASWQRSYPWLRQWPTCALSVVYGLSAPPWIPYCCEIRWTSSTRAITERYSLSASPNVCLNCSWASIKPWNTSQKATLEINHEYQY